MAELLTKREGCICTRKRPVAFSIFHPFVSFLFLQTHLRVIGKKHTRIACQPARQAAETATAVMALDVGQFHCVTHAARVMT